MASNKFFAIIAGVGPGAGRSLALRFSKAYSVVLLARRPESYEPIVADIKKAGGEAIGISTDLTDPKSVASAFQAAKKEFPSALLAAAVYNASGSFVRKPFLEATLEEIEVNWKGSPQGLFIFAQNSLPLLLEAVPTSPNPPSLLITGATASVRGSAQMGIFAAGKFAVRALGQSLAREFGPKGVHVAHAVIDGVITGPKTEHWKVNGGVADGKIDPDALAESYWNLHTQARSAFTQEIDLRPFVETF